MVYLPTFTIKNQPNVGKYSTYYQDSYSTTSISQRFPMFFFQVYTVSELAEQSTPIASALSDSFGLVQNLSFVDLDLFGGTRWATKKSLGCLGYRGLHYPLCGDCNNLIRIPIEQPGGGFSQSHLYRDPWVRRTNFDKHFS